jgi:hypothetical protein
LPANVEYIVFGVLFILYIVLRLNLLGAAISTRTSRTYLLLLFCGVALLNLRVHQNTIREGFGVDLVSTTEQSFQALHESIPNVRRVGFITDVSKRARADWLTRYLRTQYALAPRVLEDGAAPEWVIVNAVRFKPSLVPTDLVLVRDFGNGLMLFHRRAE